MAHQPSLKQTSAGFPAATVFRMVCGVALAGAALICMALPTAVFTRLYNWTSAAPSARTVTLCAPEGFPLRTAKRLSGIQAGHYSLDTVAAPSCEAALAQVDEGNSDFALVPTGTGEALDGLARVAPVARLYLHTVVPADSELNRFQDLAGRRVAVAGTNCGTRGAFDRISTFLRMQEVARVQPRAAELERAFLDGEIEAAVRMAPLFDEEMDTLLATGWYRLLPLPAAKAVAAHEPSLIQTHMPRGLYGPERNIPAAGGAVFPVAACDLVLVCGMRQGAAAVHYLQRAIHTAGLGVPGPEAGTGWLPSHPAVHLEHAGLRDQLRTTTGTAAVFLAGLLVLLAVVAFVWFGIRRERPSARLRAVLASVRAAGREAMGAVNSPDCDERLEQLAEAQERAIEMWRHGRLSSSDLQQVQLLTSVYADLASARRVTLATPYRGSALLPEEEEGPTGAPGASSAESAFAEDIVSEDVAGPACDNETEWLDSPELGEMPPTGPEPASPPDTTAADEEPPGEETESRNPPPPPKAVTRRPPENPGPEPPGDTAPPEDDTGGQLTLF